MTNRPASPVDVNTQAPPPASRSMMDPPATPPALATAAAALTRAIRDGRFTEASAHIEAYRADFDRLIASLPEDSDDRRCLVRQASDLFVWAKHEAEISRAHMQARLRRSGRILNYGKQGSDDTPILRARY